MFRRTTPDRAAHTWVEISRAALASNLAVFRGMIGRDRLLMAVVKADAYGHGARLIASTALEAGADWIGVFLPEEGAALREAGVRAPVLVLGPTPPASIDAALAADLRLTVPSIDAARHLASGRAVGATVHLKLETGTNRQGLSADELPEAVRALEGAGARIEGAYTHFADIEDTTDHAYAEAQLDRFEGCLRALESLGAKVPMPHTACTAAAILFPRTYFAMARVGIGMYGLWPSKETQVSANAVGRNRLGLEPVMTWKTRIAQIKQLRPGEYVGYGRTFRTTRETRLAVLPVGYADGYARSLSNAARVLVRGVRAPVLGRICMNLSMVDVTDVPDATPGDEVVLLGRQGEEAITAEDLARIAGTINYEIVARAAPGAPRIPV